MNFSAEPFIAAQKSNLSTVAGLSLTAFGSVEKLVELNLATGKALLSESLDSMKQLTAVKSPEDLLTLQRELAQPMAAKSASYNRHLYDIVASTLTEFGKALESKTFESQNAITAVVEAALENAPVGSESALALYHSAVNAGNQAIDNAKSAARQASQLLESNLKLA